MPTPLPIIEGRWEDVLKHSDELAGRRVRVTVLAESEHDVAELRRRLEQFVKSVQNLVPSPPTSDANAHRTEYHQALAEKYRKQGLDL